MKKMGILILAVMLLTGCVQQMDLTEQESDTIADYAANIALQHDKNYDEKLIAVNSEATDVSTTDAGEQDSQQPTDNNIKGVVDTTPLDTGIQDPNAQNQATEEPAVLDIATVLKLDGFVVTYEGFEYATEYPDTTVENGYIAKSLDNSEFVVMKFNAENTTDEAKLCDVLSLSPKINVSINGEEAIKSYESLIDNDLSILCNEIGAHESMEVVLIAEVGQEYDNNISNISLDLVVNGVTSTIVLQ
ncbi:MAG: hypothetical protein ACERKZ_15950 [Lachnotalea sp.]